MGSFGRLSSIWHVWLFQKTQHVQLDLSWCQAWRQLRIYNPDLPVIGFQLTCNIWHPSALKYGRVASVKFKKWRLKMVFKNSGEIEFLSNLDDNRCIRRPQVTAFQCTYFHQDLTKTLFSPNFWSLFWVSTFLNFTLATLDIQGRSVNCSNK